MSSGTQLLSPTLSPLPSLANDLPSPRLRMRLSPRLIRTPLQHSLSRPLTTKSTTNSTTGTTSTTTTRKPRSSPSTPPLSLEHFLLRSRVLSFYRTIVRSLFTLPPDKKRESLLYARGEFERFRNERDAGKIRYLISVGKGEWEGMERYVREMRG